MRARARAASVTTRIRVPTALLGRVTGTDPANATGAPFGRRVGTGGVDHIIGTAAADRPSLDRVTILDQFMHGR